METKELNIKELNIKVPEGYEIDKEKSTFEKIIFKKKDNKPRSWEEYCYQQQEKGKTGYYIDQTYCTPVGVNWLGCLSTYNWKNVLPTKELTDAFLAMMQLMSLRQAWIGDWKPNWDDPCSYKYCIDGRNNNDFRIDNLGIIRSSLSFPTQEMATDFMNCFKDLLEIVKPLI